MSPPPDDPPRPAPSAGGLEETVIMSQEALAGEAKPAPAPPDPAEQTLPDERGPSTLVTPEQPADGNWPAFLAPPAAPEPPPAAEPPVVEPAAVAEPKPAFDRTLDDHPPIEIPEGIDEDSEADSEYAVPPTVVEGKRRRLWPIFVALGAMLLVGAGLYVYFFIWSYEATAHRHVPANANVVVRAEGARLLLFKPVRQHLWPVLLEQKGGKEGRRVARIEEETGVSIPTDLREIVVASVDGTAWVALVGGNIDRGRFVAGLFTVLKEEEVPGWRKDSGWLVHDSGAVIGQAEDGTLIFATHRQLAEACVAVNEEDGALPVPSDGAIGFRVSHPAYKRVVALIPDQIPGDALKRVEEVSGSVMLSDEPRLDMRLTPIGGVTAASLASELESLLGKLGLVLLLVPGELYGAKEAISKARVGHSEDAVTLSAPWPYQALDEAVQRLATSLGGAKRSN